MAGLQRRIAPIAALIAAIGAGLLLHLGGGVNAAETREVEIDNYSFSPGDLIVPAGTTVTWINHDETPHTVVATGDPRAFRSGGLDTDDKFSVHLHQARHLQLSLHGASLHDGEGGGEVGRGNLLVPSAPASTPSPPNGESGVRGSHHARAVEYLALKPAPPHPPGDRQLRSISTWRKSILALLPPPRTLSPLSGGEGG